MSNQELIDAYAAGAAQLREAVAGMGDAALRAVPIAGKWSTLQVVAHIADFEPVHAVRMKFVIAHDRPLLVDGDEVAFERTLNYSHRQIEDELAIVELTRRQMASILRALPPESFDRPGIHTYRGLVTLRDLIQAAVYHIPHHAKFIQEKRRALSC